MKKDSFLKACSIITLNEYSLVAESSAYSRKQIKREALAMAIPILFWLIMGSYLGYNSTESLFAGIVTGFILMLLVFLIEIQIISAVEKNLAQKIFRVTVALALSILTAMIADILYLKGDIDLALASTMKSEIQEKNEELDINWKNQNAILIADIESSKQLVAKTYKAYDDDLSGVGNAPRGYGKVARQKEESWNLAKEELAGLELKKEFLSDSLIAEKNREEAAIKTNYANAGPLTMVKALFDVVWSSGEALATYIVIFIILLSMELYVLMTKVGVKTDYQMKLIAAKNFEIYRVELLQKNMTKILENEDLLKGTEKYLNDN